MKTVYHSNGLSISGKAWEIRAWFKQQLAKADNPYEPFINVISTRAKFHLAETK